MAFDLVHFVWFFMARSSDQLYEQNCGLLATLKPSVAIIYQPKFLPKAILKSEQMNAPNLLAWKLWIAANFGTSNLLFLIVPCSRHGLRTCY